MTNNVLTRGLLAGLVILLFARVAAAWNPIEPPDTTSPQATLRSFLALTEEAAQRLREYPESPSPVTLYRIEQIGDQAGVLFDLSQVAPALQREVTVDTFYSLWEVLARVKLPDLEKVPGETSGGGGDQAQQPKRWRVPRTEITIVRINEGPRAGEYLFSTDTVKQARHLFDAVSELPYRRPMTVSNPYLFIQTLTGWMIPQTFSNLLPVWANKPILSQVLARHAASVGACHSAGADDFSVDVQKTPEQLPCLIPVPPRHTGGCSAVGLAAVLPGQRTDPRFRYRG